MRPLAIVIICLLAIFMLISAYTRENARQPAEPASVEMQQQSETG